MLISALFVAEFFNTWLRFFVLSYNFSGSRVGWESKTSLSCQIISTVHVA